MDELGLKGSVIKSTEKILYVCIDPVSMPAFIRLLLGERYWAHFGGLVPLASGTLLVGQRGSLRSGIQEMVEQIDPRDPESMNRVMEATAMMSQRTEDQETALVRIETMLALIDGWADAIAEEAGKRLPTISSVVELASRKRATEGAAEKTFAILLGLELQPRLRREAKAMWQEVTKLGGQKRDQLWSHPDQLPSVEEISNPSLVLARLERSDDDFDEGLRKLLDN